MVGPRPRWFPFWLQEGLAFLIALGSLLLITLTLDRLLN